VGTACSKCGREERLIEVSGGGPDGKRLIGIPRHRWEDNIKTDRQEVGRGARTGFIWLRMGKGGGLLCMR